VDWTEKNKFQPHNFPIPCNSYQFDGKNRKIMGFCATLRGESLTPTLIIHTSLVILLNSAASTTGIVSHLGSLSIFNCCLWFLQTRVCLPSKLCQFWRIQSANSKSSRRSSGTWVCQSGHIKLFFPSRLAVRDVILEACGDKVLNADACYALNLYISNILFLDELAPVAAGQTDQAEARLHFCVLACSL
jgi:hypothetical protein